MILVRLEDIIRSSAIRSGVGVGFSVCSLLLLLHAQTSHASSKTSLFEFSAHVKELKQESLDSIKNDPSSPWVINSYSPGCPHCKKFAPKWEEVAEQLQASRVNVGAINCVKHLDLCRSLKVNRYPTLYALNWPGAPAGDGDNPPTKVLEKTGTAEEIAREVESIFCEGEEGLLQEAAVEKEFSDLGGAGAMAMGDTGAPCFLRVEDAVASIRYCLRNEFFIENEPMSGERRDAALSFLNLLATTFPEPASRGTFRQLEREFQRDLNVPDRWDARIKTLQIGTVEAAGKASDPNSPPSWPAAFLDTGKDNESNYLSGLWALFHVLSVSESPTRQMPYDVMTSIHSFATNFFRCDACRSHFLQMYEKPQVNGRSEIPSKQALAGNDRHNPPYRGEAQLALWVWRAHNTVNARLAKEEEELAGEPGGKTLWPTERACPDCWGGFPKAQGEPSWREDAVLKLLKTTYSCPVSIEESQDSLESNWTMVCLLIVSVLLLVLWGRRRAESRGVGLSKKRADQSLPDV